MSKFMHPLAETVMAMFEKHEVLDVTIVAGELGSPSRPLKGPRAYRIVAADVLCCLHSQKRVVRHGTINPGKIEDGGHWYTLPTNTNTYDERGCATGLPVG